MKSVVLAIFGSLFFISTLSAFAQTKEQVIYQCGSRIAPFQASNSEDWKGLQKDSNKHNRQVDACMNNLANQAAFDAIPSGAPIPGMMINGRPVYKCSSGLPCIGRIMREAGVK